MAAMTTTNTTPRIPDPVTWFEIHSADPDRAKQFYGDVFGWAFDDSLPGYSMIQLGDGPIGGGVFHTGGNAPNDAVFMVQVPDVAATLTSVQEHGGSVVVDAQKMPTGLSFGYAANPDGSVFGVWCPPPA
jgi:predicted enzyme related to lactoylglutathione lyase